VFYTIECISLPIKVIDLKMHGETLKLKLIVYRVEATEVFYVCNFAAVVISCYGGSESNSVAQRKALAIGMTCSKGRGEFL